MMSCITLSSKKRVCRENKPVNFIVPFKKAAKLQSFFDDNFYPIFICGVAGGGNSLLSSLLDQRYLTAGYLNESALAAPAGSVLRMESVASYGALDRYWAAMFIPGNVTDREIHRSAIKLYRKASHYPKPSNFIIDKAPNTHLVRAGRLRNAFARSKFLMVFRDPVSHIEGLRRKWPVFAQADLMEVCNFWETAHHIFLTETSDFAESVRSIAYERLVSHTDAVLDQLAQFCGLQPRIKPKKYRNRPNQPGKGLRNVVNGQVKVAPQASSDIEFCLSALECEMVQQRLFSIYERLIHYADNK